MYLDKPLEVYLNDLASSMSTPGGGSASALSGAMGAALLCMVARLTLGKADYADVQQEIEDLIQQGEHLRARFQQLMQEDIEAYAQLSACFKMSRSTSEERAARTRAIQAKLVAAALVPLEMVERAAELVQACLRVAEIGNKSVLSDVATGAMLASGSGMGASWMVRVNLRAMKDLERAAELDHRLDTALDTISSVSLRVINRVGARA